jgi:hypothetical protein
VQRIARSIRQRLAEIESLGFPYFTKPNQPLKALLAPLLDEGS